MRDNPVGIGSPPAVLLFRLDAPVPAPLPAGELGPPDDAGELLDGLPFPHLLALDQHHEHGFDTVKPIFQRHDPPQFTLRR